MEITTKSEKETFQVGQTIAGTLKGGDILALFGDLGSGKTTLTKGLAAGLKINTVITSPTFNIVKEYPLDGRGKLIHIDAYRLTSEADAISIGMQEMMANKENIIVLEWPERIWEMVKSRAKRVELTYIKEKIRRIEW